MNITEIENMTWQEIKARRDELVKALGGGELASRYVQARMDAKLFDANSGELSKRCDALGRDVLEWQKTVANLNELAAKDKEEFAAALAAKDAEIVELNGQHAIELAQAHSKTLEVAEQLRQSQARVAELEAKVAKFRAALEG